VSIGSGGEGHLGTEHHVVMWACQAAAVLCILLDLLVGGARDIDVIINGKVPELLLKSFLKGIFVHVCLAMLAHKPLC